MVLESALRSFWPALTAAGAFWAALAFGLAGQLNPAGVWIVTAFAALLILYLLILGFGRFRWPSRAAAVARLDSTLSGRPLAALEDTPALGTDDPAVLSVWEVHRQRMAERASKAGAASPDLRLASRDPWALRLVVLVLFIAAVVFSRTDGVSTLAGAFGPTASSDAVTGPSYEGWAEPPLYTGRPTLYLPDVGSARPVSLPKGTRITLRTYGAPEDFTLSEGVSTTRNAQLGPVAEGISLAEFAVAESGRVELRRDGDEIGAWTFTIEPDAPPSIALAKPLERAPGGVTRLSYTARDDHGVTAARAEITLDLDAIVRRYGLAVAPETRPVLEVDLPLPLGGTAEDIAETIDEDLTKHPWAGLPVKVILIAEDALGQSGRSEPASAVLADRGFYDPTAAALAEQRRDLLWSVENARRVTQVLRAVSWRPEGLFDRIGAYLITRTVIRRLDAAEIAESAPAVRDELAEALWRAALLLEEGSLGDAADRLAKAKERLQEALRGDASDEEIAELMEELREATRDYMEQMAREAIENGQMETAEAPPEGQSMSQDQLQELMDRIQELSEQGRRAEAEALLDMLQQLLENMEMRLTQGGEGQGGDQSQQSMQGLADTLREQQGLADDSFEQLQREFQQGGGQPDEQGQGTPGQQPGSGHGHSGQSLAERQDALRQLLEDLQDDLPGSAGEGTREALDEAERSMRSAREGLSDGDTAEALDDQANAIDNLREGIRSLSKDIQQAQGGQGNQDAPGENGQESRSTDPLGRPLSSSGGLGTDRQMIPEGGDAAARARSILEEIRRRSGDLSRPEIELDYLRRLLDRF
jgi:uncharacterized protein (TIGR02302 family)